MQICILDFETSGLSPKEALPLELGAVITSPTWGLEKEFSEFFFYPGYTVPPEITAITGITSEMLIKGGKEPREVLLGFLSLVEGCEIFIAHNAAFDGEILARAVTEAGIKTKVKKHPIFKKENWLCTVSDVSYPSRFRCRTLSHLCVDYGIWPRKGESPHRALTDVNMLRRMLRAGGFVPSELLRLKNEPRIYLEAQVEKPWEDDYLTVNAAKADGYRWEKWPGEERVFDKKWIKKIRKSELAGERAKELIFKRVVVE